MAENQDLNCPVCLERLKDPVTIPCGHSYCVKCIQNCWQNEETHQKSYTCPQCRQGFDEKPVLKKNTVLNEVISKMGAEQDDDGGEKCDFCTGSSRDKAVKSCLTCLASFCEAHVKAHFEFPVLQRHVLVEPSPRLQERLCSVHNKLLEVFCDRDKRCVCLLCAMDDHRDHMTVSVSKEWTKQQKPLLSMQEQCRELLLSREGELQVLNKAVKDFTTAAQASIDYSTDFMAELTKPLEAMLSQVSRVIRASEKAELLKAGSRQNKLELEIAGLKIRAKELQELAQTDDHILFVKKFHPLVASSGPETFSPVRENISFAYICNLLSELKQQLQEICDEKITQIRGVPKLSILLPTNPKTRREFREYFVELKLCPNSRNLHLELSEENRKVYCYPHYVRNVDAKQCAEQFTSYKQVLCDSAVKGRCYWEIEQSGTVHIALAYGTISRNSGNLSRFGYNDQSWCLESRTYSLQFLHNGIASNVPGRLSKKVGVYLDEKAGELAFYNISSFDTMDLLYRAELKFTKPLYVGFGLESDASVTLLNASLFTGS